MTRKRKSSKRKPRSRVMPLLLAGAAAINRQVARHPAALGGTVCFFVVFGFVAANALWYQPGRHPAPFLKTREPGHFAAIAGVRRNPLLDQANGRVTTFRIERENAANAASPSAAMANAAGAGEADPVLTTAAVPLPRPVGDLSAGQRVDVRTDNGVDPVAAAILSADASLPADPALPSPRPKAVATGGDVASAVPVRAEPVAAVPQDPAQSVEMVLEIQRGLSNIAYTDVTVDGVAGAQTRAAIRHFEHHYRLPETGEPNEQVLNKLRSIGAL
ncbi:peptidoglycan-binding domain-containing protein [Rhizobium halophytocola]|uniref:Peptidoglycan hydrolase-like protein with peptidoglycan-binding domain n=1 Tax=Rhizobium halophytocola TaxID=735519 RepID=A0ABS4E5V1_9HYPH|nr:peptidoglycan-binding domain-containing protein [Rhizobium halophytocola]MBP1853288.1 peptidoglycan hydrolase-like protein with peptidoglycan-binding domain [Rhizobium halophytocola]